MWGRFKSRFGWEAKAFLVEWHGGGSGPLLVLSRKIAPGIRMAYIPWGPEICGNDVLPEKAATDLALALRPLLSGDTCFVRFDPPWFCDDSSFSDTLPLPFKRASADIQPPCTVIVDLLPPAQDILAAMKPKWRYNIGLAEKRGVTVNSSFTNANDAASGIDIFYNLLCETAKRDGIAVHSIDYYKTLFEECRNSDSGTATKIGLYTAWHEGDCLAAIVVLLRGAEATYLYGASSNNKRNLMAPYALQWKAMQDAKEAGCTRYDFFGIPPNDDPDHPMAGLYRFKTGFGGNIVRRPGSWDYPLRPAVYALFSMAENLRKKLRDRRKKRG